MGGGGGVVTSVWLELIITTRGLRTVLVSVSWRWGGGGGGRGASVWLEWVITVHELRTMLISLTWRVEDRDAYVVRIDHHSPWIENSVGKLDF